MSDPTMHDGPRPDPLAGLSPADLKRAAYKYAESLQLDFISRQTNRALGFPTLDARGGDEGLREIACRLAWKAHTFERHPEPITRCDNTDCRAALAAGADPVEVGYWTHATAKGTAIDVDEWNRPLYVYNGEARPSGDEALRARIEAALAADERKFNVDKHAIRAALAAGADPVEDGEG